MQEIIIAANALIGTFKELKELYEKADYIGLKSHILDMNEQLLNMKEIALEYRDENINLKEEIDKLKTFSGLELEMRKGVYFDKNNNGPYCPNCYNNGRKLNLMCKVLSFPETCQECNYALER